jgi:hypothetical protein
MADGGKVAVLYPAGRRDFSVGQGLQAKSEAHTASIY